jgi:hypothetical protein
MMLPSGMSIDLVPRILWSLIEREPHILRPQYPEISVVSTSANPSIDAI